MPRPRRATLLCLGATVALAGCGGGEPATVRDRDASLHLTLTDFRITPQDVEVQAQAIPQRVHVVIRNRGRLTHNVKVESIEAGSEQGGGDQPVVYGGTATAQPGATEADDVYLRPGRYRMTDTIANHDNLGQYGELVVLAPREGGS